jgi:probable rRNA maturation factor
MAAAARNPPSRRGRFGGTGARALHVDVVDARGRRQHVRGLAAWLRRIAPPRARGAVTIVLVSDPRMRALNRTYRGKDYSTDVLSFPHRAPSPPAFAPSKPPGASARQALQLAPNHEPLSGFLGDIVIARNVAKRQARAAGHTELDELRVLALHGLLHLLGYDHERDNGRMRQVERRLRRQGGLREGLIERAAE